MMVQMNFARKYKCLSIIGRYISLHLFVLTRFFIGFRQWKIYLRVWSIWRHVLFNINFRLQRGKQILAPSWRTKWVEKALTGMSSDCEDDSRQISLLSHQVEDHRAKSRWGDWSLKSLEVLKNCFLLKLARRPQLLAHPGHPGLHGAHHRHHLSLCLLHSLQVGRHY